MAVQSCLRIRKDWGGRKFGEKRRKVEEESSKPEDGETCERAFKSSVRAFDTCVHCNEIFVNMYGNTIDNQKNVDFLSVFIRF